MQWIKASERLPEKPGKYWIKFTNHRGEQKTGSIFDGFKFNHHKSEIEWLDESPQPSKDVEKAAEKYFDEMFELERRDNGNMYDTLEDFIAGAKWAEQAKEVVTPNPVTIGPFNFDALDKEIKDMFPMQAKEDKPVG